MDAPEYPETPAIEFLSMSKNTLDFRIDKDSILVTIKFQDGDGDLGTNDRNDYVVGITHPNFPLSSSNPRLLSILPFPQTGVAKAISGEITFKMQGECCTLGCSDPAQPPQELIPFKIHIKDRAGNKSNEIILPQVIIPCPQ